MDAVAHGVHDQRLVAIEPESRKVRLFAAVGPLLHRNGQPAVFTKVRDKPNYDCLLWHYRQCLVENMCAKFLQQEGLKGKRQFTCQLLVNNSGVIKVKPYSVPPDNIGPTSPGAQTPATGPSSSSSNIRTNAIHTVVEGLGQGSSPYVEPLHASTKPTCENLVILKRKLDAEEDRHAHEVYDSPPELTLSRSPPSSSKSLETLRGPVSSTYSSYPFVNKHLLDCVDRELEILANNQKELDRVNDLYSYGQFYVGQY